MKYEKPEITLTADAVEVIHGSKTTGPADSGQPHHAPRSHVGSVPSASARAAATWLG